jgi:hypothetical protein
MSIHYNQQTNLGDSILNLPVDKTIPTETESRIVNTLFNTHKETMNSVMEESKDSFIVALLIILLSLPQINEIVTRFVPSASTSEYTMLLVKGIMGGVFFWIIKHFYLSKRQK